MNEQRRTDSIEIAMLVGLLCIIGVLAFSLADLGKPANSTKTICISGYQFVTGKGGGTLQVLDDQGHGIKCP